MDPSHMQSIPPLQGLTDPKALGQAAIAKVSLNPPLAQNVTVEIKIPNRLVGLVIGKGGEKIQQLQGESGAKIQVAPDGSEINGERVVTISGTNETANHAKNLVLQVVNTAQAEVTPSIVNPVPQTPGHVVDEYMIPAHRVGLVIGKGGEMIKSLSERSGTKLQVLQDGVYANTPEKPLKIVGPRDACERAKQFVAELLASREGGGNPAPAQQSHQMLSSQYGPDFVTIPFTCPAHRCGIIIGKGGDMIRQLQQQSGAVIELNRDPTPNSDEKIFIVKGPRQQVDYAHDLMKQKLLAPIPGKGPQPTFPQQQGSPYGYGSQQMYPQQQSFGTPQQSWGFGQYQQQGMQASTATPQNTTQPTGGSIQPPASSQGVDYTSAWAAYYQQMYQQQGTDTTQSNVPQQTGAGATASQDANAQAWAEYYRQYGYSYPYGGQPGGDGTTPASSALSRGRNG